MLDKQMDKITFQQMDQLHSKFLGTGNADTSRQTWLANLEHDMLALYIGQPSLLNYLAVGLNEHPKRLQSQLLRAYATGKK